MKSFVGIAFVGCFAIFGSAGAASITCPNTANPGDREFVLTGSNVTGCLAYDDGTNGGASGLNDGQWANPAYSYVESDTSANGDVGYIRWATFGSTQNGPPEKSFGTFTLTSGIWNVYSEVAVAIKGGGSDIPVWAVFNLSRPNPFGDVTYNWEYNRKQGISGLWLFGRSPCTAPGVTCGPPDLRIPEPGTLALLGLGLLGLGAGRRRRTA